MIGEKSVDLRAAVGKKIACLGFGLDQSKNTTVDEAEGVVVDIGVLEAGDKKRLLVCRTDEQVRMGCCVREKCFGADVFLLQFEMARSCAMDVFSNDEVAPHDCT